MGVASVLIASGAWFQDKDKVDSNVTLGHIELNDNFKRFTQFTIPIVLSRQNVLEEDILFTPSVDTGNLYVRFKVSYPIMANTSLRARDVQHYQKITPFTTSDQNHVNFGHKWVQVGEYFYFCDENGVPSILTKNDHKENEEDYYVFLQKDALTISSRMSKNLFAENEELTLQISVEAIQSDNVNSEIDENGQIIAGQDGIVDGIDDIVYAFSEQYPTDKYEWEFISESGSLINNFKDLRYGDKVELPTYSVSSDKTFVEWNTSADGTGAPITNDVIESITESKKVYAIVHQNEVKISVSAGPNGTIKPYSPEINGYMVDYATDQTFEIVPDIGYKISSITVDGSNVEIEAREGMSQKYTFSNITIEHSISATFEAREFVITYNTLTENSGGEPTFVSSVTNVRYPNQHSIDITPPQGYSISSILVDNIALEKEAFDPTGHTIDFGVVTQDHIVVATFSRIKYTITYHKNGGQEETGKENPTTIYITDEARDLNPVLKTNNIFVGWYDNSLFNGSIIKQIPANPTGNLNYYAKFIEQSTLEKTANYGYQIFPNFDYDFAGIKVVEENGLLHIKYDATTASGSNISLTPAKTYVKVGNSYVEKTLADFGSINNLRVKITSKNQTNFGTLANSGSTSLQNVPGSSNNDYYYFSAQNFKSLISNKNVTSFDAILETIEAITPAQTSTNGDVSLIIATNSALPQGLSYAFVWMGPNGTISNQEISSHESIVLGQSTLNSAFYTATQSGEYSCQVSIKDENNNNVITPFKISWTIDINRDIHFTQMSNITKTYDAKPAVPKVSDLPIGASVTYSYTGTLANGSLVSGFGNSFVDAGEYQVTAQINGGKYYRNATSTCIVKINRATLSIPDAQKDVTVLPGSTFLNPLTSPTVASDDISGLTFSSNIASVQVNATTGVVTILSDKNIDRQTATITIDGGNNFVGLSYTVSQHPFVFSNSTTLSSYVGIESDVEIPETITDVNKIVNGRIQATKENAFTPNTIAAGAFSNIANLRTLTFPAATTTMQTGAISSCPSLQKIITKSTLSSNYSLSGIRESSSWYRGGVEVSEITIAGIYNNSGIIEGSSSEWEYSNGEITAYLGTSTNIKVPHRIYNVNTGTYDTVTKINKIIGANSKIAKNDIKSVIISDNIIEIGEYAFNSFEGLEKVVLPTTLEIVGNSAFAHSSNITSAINLGACINLKQVGVLAFANCGNALMGTLDLTGATQLSSLGSYCFAAAFNLTEIRLPSNIQTIGQEYNIVGADYNLSKITVGGTFVAENNNVLYNSAKTVLYAYAPKNSRTSYTVPESVGKIVGAAFAYANSLEEITLGSNLTSVGLDAFSDCTKLMKINVPTGKSSTYATLLSDGFDATFGFNDGCLMYENGIPKYGYVASTYTWVPVKTINLTISGNGTGLVKCDGVAYTQSATIYVIPTHSYTLSITPDSGSFIKSVVADSTSIELSHNNSETFEYVFSNISDSNHTLAVSFQSKVFEIFDGTTSFYFDGLQDAVTFAQQKYPKTLVQLSLFVDYENATAVDLTNAWFDYTSLKTLNVPINITSESKLNILGGTFVAQINQKGGILTINGGTIKNIAASAGTATINDGAISTLSSSVDITITGGTISALNLNNSSIATIGNPVIVNATLDSVSDYTAIDYLESTGTQYIDTGLTMEKSDSVRLEMEAHLTNNGNWAGVNGYMQYQANLGSGNKGLFVVDYNGSTHIEKVTFDGATKYTQDWTSSYSETNNKIGVIGMGNKGNTWWTDLSALNKNAQIGKWYYIKVYKAGKLVRDYIPAIRNSDGVAGLYDKVEGKFYTNSGTGSFATGATNSNIVIENADYKKIESLKFTGKEYINTGVIPTANTKVEATFKTSTNEKWLFGSRTAYGNADTYALYLVTGSNSIWFQYAGTGPSQKSVSAYSGQKSTITVNNNSIYWNGTLLSTFSVGTLSSATYPMFLGDINNNGAKDGRSFVGDIYSFKIWEGSTLIRDFVPVVRSSDGVAGLWDSVEGKFYQSSSSKQFDTPNFGSSIKQTQALTHPINLTVSSPVQGQVVVTGTPTQSNYKLTNKNHSLVLEGEQIKIYSAFDVRAYARGSATNSGTHTSIGGVIEPSSVLLKLGEKTTLTAVADQGWRFGGWYTSVDGNGKPNGTKLSASETIEISYANGMASIYYAHFIKTQTIKINFESIVSSPADVTITANDSISVSPETISSTGSVEVVFDYSISNKAISATVNSSSNKYNLIWSTTPTAEQTTSAVSTTVSASADSTISLTLTQLFTITYDANGGTGTVANQTVAFRQPFTTNNGSSLSRSGYSLSGWNTSSDGNGTNYMPNQNVTTYSDANDITLYAMWKGNAVKVTFDPQTMTPNFTGSQTLGGLTITNNGDGTITFNGTLTGSTNSIAIADVYVAQGQNIDVYMTYVSGARSFSGACFVTEISRDGTTSQRPIDRAFLDINNGNSPDSNPGVRTKSGSIPVDSPTRAACEKFFFWMWKSDTGTATFENYRVKFEVSPAPQKEVYIGETYGELPIPQRAGYKFESWNGGSKNLVNNNIKIEGGWQGEWRAIDVNEGKYTLRTSRSGSAGSSWKSFFIDVTKYVGKKVSISGKITNIVGNNATISYIKVGQGNTSQYPLHIAGSSDSKQIYGSSGDLPVAFSHTCTIISGTSIMGLCVWINATTANGYVDVTVENLQIEVSDSATDFESPIKTVTSSTIVTNQHDHDLLATWSPVSYQIAYDSNGGAGRMDNSTHTYGVPKALSKNTFSRDGYDFVGWATQSDGNGTFYSDGQIVTNLANAQDAIVTLYAKWTGATYTISFDSTGTGGTLSKTTYQTKPEQQDITVVADPTKKGYTVESYSTSNEKTYIIGKTLTIPANAYGNIVLIPTWKPKTYIITYERNGGIGTMDDDKITYNDHCTIKACAYTKTGYDFDGWLTKYPDGSFKNDGWTNWSGTWQYDNGEWGISNDTLVLTATWKLHTYTITIDPNGGTGGTTSHTFTYNESAQTVSFSPPTKKGYHISSWSSDYTNASVNGSTINIPAETAQDFTITANWTANKYTINYNANGGTGTMESQSVTFDTTMAIKDCTFTKTGYQFVRWKTKYPDGSFKDDGWTNWSGTWTYDDGQFGITNKTLNLYAEWSANTYTVTFNPGSGKFLTTTSVTIEANTDNYNYRELSSLDVKITKNTTYTLKFATATHTAGSATQFAVLVYDFTDGVTKAKTLVSFGNNVTATLTTDSSVVQSNKNKLLIYSANNGETAGNGATFTGISLTVSKQVTYDSTYGTLPTPTRTGYSFAGWWTSSTGGTQVTSTTTMKTANNHTLYAHWTANNYTITWNGSNASLNANLWDYAGSTGYTSSNYGSNGSYTYSGKTATSKATFNSSLSYKTPIPQRLGHTLSGWFTAESGGTKVADASGSLVASVSGYTDYSKHWIKADNVTLYPQWTANSYAVEYTLNGGTKGSTSPSSYTFGTNTTISDPTKNGYTFAGWSVTATLDEKKSGTINISTGILQYDSNYPNAVYFPLFYQKAGVSYTGKLSGGEIRWRHYTTAGAYSGNGSGTTSEARFLSLWYHLGMSDDTTTLSWAGGKSFKIDANQVGKLSLTANWTAITYTVAYNGNGNTGGSTASSTHTYDVYKALTANGFKRTGYTFAGWKKDNAGPTYSDKQSVTNLANTQGATVTLYAQWTANSYTVSFDAIYNWATAPTSKTVTYDGTYGTLSDPTKNSHGGTDAAGYTFKGWYTSASGGTKVTSTTKVTTASNHTLYAVWEGINMYITLYNKYDSYGSTSGNMIRVQYNGNIYTNILDGYNNNKPFTSAPTLSEYTFGGYWTGKNGTGTQWFDANGNLTIDSSQLYTSLIPYTTYANTFPLYAKWTQTYTITVGSKTTTYSYSSSSQLKNVQLDTPLSGYEWTVASITQPSTTPNGYVTAEINKLRQRLTIRIPAGTQGDFSITIRAQSQCGNTFQCCVDGETDITMADGTTKKAKDISSGDEVLSFNQETNSFEATTIEMISTPTRLDILEITFVDGSVLRITNDHPLLTTRGWTAYDLEKARMQYSSLGLNTSELCQGDEVITANGTNKIATIKVIEFEDPTTVYTFKLANGNSFIANGNVVASLPN